MNSVSDRLARTGSARASRSLALVGLMGLLSVLATGCGGSTKPTEPSLGSAAAVTATTPATTTPATPANPALAKKPVVARPSGPAPKTLQTKDLVVGTGPAVSAGQQVTVQYVGVLYKDGQQFDASWDRGQPFPFKLGAGMVIPGWDKGIPGMHVGGRRELIIPAALAYGAAGSPPKIGPNEPLIFVVDMLSAQ